MMSGIMSGNISYSCYPLCRTPTPCQLKYFPSPCICTVAQPAGAGGDGEGAESASARQARTARARE